MREDARSLLPLAPAALHVLLALAREPMHGYGIMKEVARQSGGAYKLGPGTLYDNLGRMLEQGLVQAAAQAGEDPRRRTYKLTSLGRGVLAAEAARLETVVREARLRLDASKPRRA